MLGKKVYKKKMKEWEAWRLMADAFAQAQRVVIGDLFEEKKIRYCCEILGDGVVLRNFCICNVMSYLCNLKKITRATFNKMKSRLDEFAREECVRDGTAYLFPIDKKGARQRSQFCLEMYEKTKPSKGKLRLSL